VKEAVATAAILATPADAVPIVAPLASPDTKKKKI
jgi:hypothetical protein